MVASLRFLASPSPKGDLQGLQQLELLFATVSVRAVPEPPAHLAAPVLPDAGIAGSPPSPSPAKKRSEEVDTEKR